MSFAKYVIIGGGLAAARACEGIREVDAEGAVCLVTQEAHFPYHRPPLSKSYLAGTRERERLYVHPEAYYQEQGIEVRTKTKATRISRRSRKVFLDSGDDVEYEKLLLATGGRARRLPLSGADLPGVFTLRTLDDADAIRSAAEQGRRVVVIGGSLIGCEVAATLAQRDGFQVTMCFLEQYPLQAIVPKTLGEYISQRFTQYKVRLVPATRPERIEGESRVQAVRLESGETVPCDLVIMGVGIRPNIELAQEAGLDLLDMNSVLVDETLRTSDAHIYAAGDIVAWPEPHYKRHLRMEHWDVAYHQGHIAGRNMAGANEPYARLPYFFSDIFDLSFEVWGVLDGWQKTVTRGSLAEGSVSYWYFANDILIGVLAIGRPDEEREAMERLVAKGLPYSRVASSLQDEAQPLTSFL